jgi:predicted phosphodiesterase
LCGLFQALYQKDTGPSLCELRTIVETMNFLTGSILSAARYLFAIVGINLILCFNVFAGDIVIWGDSQDNYPIQEKMVQLILSAKPSAIFRVGDMVSNGHDLEQWSQFKRINKPLLEKFDYFPAFGNHEAGSPTYFDIFPSLGAQHWYSVDRENIHVIVLDSNLDIKPGSEQYQWLVTDLQRSKEKATLTIVLCHHPLFNVGIHMDDEKGLRPILLPLFKQYDVRAVFSGHDHHYERFEYAGIQFIVTGGGGAGLYPQMRKSPYLKKLRIARHICVLRPEKHGLLINIIDIDGNIIETIKVLSDKQGH